MLRGVLDFKQRRYGKGLIPSNWAIPVVLDINIK